MRIGALAIYVILIALGTVAIATFGRAEPGYRLARDVGANHRYAPGDVVVAPRTGVLRPETSDADDFAGRYAATGAQAGSAVTLEGTLRSPRFPSRPGDSLVFVRLPEAIDDRTTLDAGTHADVCPSGSKPTCAAKLEVAALVCRDAERHDADCAVALFVPNAERAAVANMPTPHVFGQP